MEEDENENPEIFTYHKVEREYAWFFIKNWLTYK